MARPQTEDGFVMIALDLFAALMAADLPNRDCIVLAEMLVHCYGPRKASSVHLDPAQIEHYTGLHRNNARRAIGELEKAGIIARQDDGSYAFVKDYESWTPGGTPIGDRLGGGVLRFAQSTVSRVGRRPATKAASAPVAIQLDSPGAGHVNPTGLTIRGSCQSNGIDPHIEDRAPEDQKTEDQKIARTTRPATIPLDFRKPSVVGPGRDSGDALEAERFGERIGFDPRGESYGFWAREQCEFMPSEWVLSILEVKVVGNGRRPTTSVLTKIAADWRAAGKPEWAIGAAPATDGRPAPAARETIAARRKREIAEELEAAKAKRAAREQQEGHHAGS